MYILLISISYKIYNLHIIFIFHAIFFSLYLLHINADKNKWHKVSALVLSIPAH